MQPADACDKRRRLRSGLRWPHAHTCLAAALLVASACAAADAASADPNILQESAIGRIDAYVDHFRRTFDRTALLGELAQAEQELGESIDLFRADDAPEELARSLVKLGDIHRYRDEWDAAIERYREATREATEAAVPRQQVKAMLGHARALVYGKRAPGSAAELIEQAIALAAAQGDSENLFDALDLKAQVEITQGELIAAADSLNRAFAAGAGIDDQKLLFYGHLDRADLYQKLAERCDFERVFEPCLEAAQLARRDYEQALTLAQELRWTGLAQQVQGFLSRIGIREQLIASQARLHQTVTSAGVFAPEQTSDVLVTERFVVGENPQLAGLLAWIEAEGGLPPATDARGAYVQGLLREMGGDADGALAWYLSAVDLLEQDRRALHSEQARGGFLEDKVEFYYTTTQHLLERGRVAEAFAVMEQSRARVMADLLASRGGLELADTEQRALYAEALELSARIARQQERLFQARSALPRSPERQTARAEPLVAGAGDSARAAVLTGTGGSAARLEEDLAGLERAYRALRERMRQQSPRLARLLTSEPTSLTDLQRLLTADGSEALAYLVLESQVIVWHIGPDAVHVRSVFLPRSELKRKVASLRDGLVDPERSFDQSLAHQLYLFLVAPVLEWIESERLVLIPHEDLHYLPFQTLITDIESGRYLGEQYAITYAPSATVLAALPAPEPLRAERLLAVADPGLKHAPGEVRAIAAQFPDAAETRLQTDALPTVTELNAWLPRKDLVHLAVHGRFVSDQPLLSHLQLAASASEDGRLTAAEMYGLPLDAAKLVVLSACETGTVRATHANEVLGMTRGLLFAGADALLLSAWAIDDEATAAWMRTFYDAAASMPLGAASREAIQQIHGNPAYAHPYYWGAFLAIGR